MPFATTSLPSIQAGLLTSIARRDGHACEALYFNLDFADVLGREPYEQLAHLPLPLLGEWLFSVAAFRASNPDPADAFLDEIELSRIEARVGLNAEQLRTLRHQTIPAFIEGICDAVDFGRYDVVGFSSVFQQTTASLAVATRIKARHPHVVTIFGGPNCHDVMGLELVARFSCIDYAAISEADDSFPKFLAALANGRGLDDIPNIVSRSSCAPACVMRAPTHELSRLPVPSYEDFFDRLTTLGLADGAMRDQLEVPFEGSRGCWWGAKHHCTFCGLDRKTIGYRSKSAERVEQELCELAARHGVFRFFSTDNIADMAFFEDLFPTLARKNLGFSIFFEVKSNLKREQLRIMRQAGVDRIQPGIESLNSHILALMDKGVTALQNINLLRWGRYYGFDVDWNVLWGFPGETAEDYEAMAAMSRSLCHLQPPTHVGRIQLFRFSPMFWDRERFPVQYCVPNRGYRLIFPKGVDLEAIAYHFDYQFTSELPQSDYEPLTRAIEAWRDRSEGTPVPELTYRYVPGLVTVKDSRNTDRSKQIAIRGPVADLYVFCSDQPRNLKQLYERLNGDYTGDEIQRAFADLASQQLVAHEDQHYLALAIPAGAPV